MGVLSRRKWQDWYKTNIKYRHNKFAKTLSYEFDKVPYSRAAIVNKACAVTQATDYLEIGCYANHTFHAVPVVHKIGVDPERGGTHRMTSDDFFAQNKAKFNVIFIDGLHHYEQVHKDLVNSLKVLKPGGMIILDDLMPLNWKQEHQPIINSSSWVGDCWKCAFEVTASKGLDFKILLCDSGTGVIKPQAKHAPLADLSDKLLDKRFAYFYKNHKKLPIIEAVEGLRWMQKRSPKA